MSTEITSRVTTSRLISVASFIVVAWSLGSPLSVRGQFLVNEPGDAFDADLNDGICAICAATDGGGDCIQFAGCTLVAAIQNANLLAGVTQITFSTPTVSNTINQIPMITRAVIIDGSLPGGRVVIQGPGPSPSAPGFLISGPATNGTQIKNIEIRGYSQSIEFQNSSDGFVTGSIIRGDIAGSGNGILTTGTSERLTIGGSTDTPGSGVGNIILTSRTGIRLNGLGDNLIAGNLIGIDALNQAGGNTFGISINTTAGPGTVIGGSVFTERNVISNSQFDGISLTGSGIGVTAPVEDVKIFGNYIGTDISGFTAQGNLRGITLNKTIGIEVGDDDYTHGNLISGNTDGIWLNGGAVGDIVKRNRIGQTSGGYALGNTGNGIVIRDSAKDNIVVMNEITASGEAGILVTKVNQIPDGNEIENNRIGFTVWFSDPEFGNGAGVWVVNATSTIIGGADGNEILLSQTDGIRIEGSESIGTEITGNWIGRDKRLGNKNAGNHDAGISIMNGASLSLISGNHISYNRLAGIQLLGSETHFNTISLNYIGTDAFQNDLLNFGPGIRIDDGAHKNTISENVIGFNFVGIDAVNGQQNAFLQNAIFDHTGLSIDLNFPGSRANDLLDPDVGSNGLQNYPQIETVEQINGMVEVRGVLYSKPLTTYRVEFFADTDGDDRDEAFVYLGFENVATDIQGEGEFLFSFVGNELDITATATDPSGNTSELIFGGYIRAAALAVDIDGPDVAIEGTTTEMNIAVLNTGNVDLTDVLLSIDPTSELMLDRVVVDPSSVEVLCPGNPAICTIGDLGAGEGALLHATFTVAQGTGFRVSSGAVGKDDNDRVVESGISDLDGVISGVGVEEAPRESGSETIPQSVTEIRAAFPNPFRNGITVRYTQAGSDAAELTVYDALGRTVKTFPSEGGEGEYDVFWDATNASSVRIAPGIYFLKLEQKGHVIIRPVSLVE